MIHAEKGWRMQEPFNTVLWIPPKFGLPKRYGQCAKLTPAKNTIKLGPALLPLALWKNAAHVCKDTIKCELEDSFDFEGMMAGREKFKQVCRAVDKQNGYFRFFYF